MVAGVRWFSPFVLAKVGAITAGVNPRLAEPEQDAVASVAGAALELSDPDDVEALVQVDNPSDGATVTASFTVSGRAAAFEANVVWELKQGDTVVKDGFTTAQECCTLAPYSFEVTDVAPGSYTLVVHDTDESGQGRPVDQDTKEIIVK